MSHVGEIDCCCNDDSPVSPPLPLQGSPPVAGWQTLMAGKGRLCGSSSVIGGNLDSALAPEEVPQPQQMSWHFSKDGHLHLLARRRLWQQW